MHLTLKREATKPAAANVLPQQARFDTFIARYNDDRPHQALAMKVPADVYTRSPRLYRGLADLAYPFHDIAITVTHCGRICFKGRKVNLSQAFAGQTVGVTQVGDRIWLVSLHAIRTDRESLRAESVTYVFGMNCYLCVRNGPRKSGSPHWTISATGWSERRREP